jgi:hypothetical protein
MPPRPKNSAASAKAANPLADKPKGSKTRRPAPKQTTTITPAKIKEYQQAYLHPKSTKTAYEGYLRRAREWLKAQCESEEYAVAQDRLYGGQTSSHKVNYEDHPLEDPDFARAFEDGVATTPVAIAMFMFHECTKEGEKNAGFPTAKGIKYAFRDHFLHL